MMTWKEFKEKVEEKIKDEDAIKSIDIIDYNYPHIEMERREDQWYISGSLGRHG